MKDCRGNLRCDTPSTPRVGERITVRRPRASRDDSRDATREDALIYAELIPSQLPIRRPTWRPRNGGIISEPATDTTTDPATAVIPPPAARPDFSSQQPMRHSNVQVLQTL